MGTGILVDPLPPVRDFHNPKKVLKERMEYHNNPANDKLTNLQTEIDEVKDVAGPTLPRPPASTRLRCPSCGRSVP